ncbi:MAG: hypothetical protein ACTSPD_10060 [Promethearchaeota archaeon]
MYKIIVSFKDGKKIEDTFQEYDKACHACSEMWRRYTNILRVSVVEVKK